jgi:tRNA (cmo5U34)-methyltransferase
VKLNGFDRIAFTYDFLAKFVFGKSIVDSQKHFLNKIEDNSKVLILGGGSGWLLAELLKNRPNCKVCYIEASEKMLALSKGKIDTGYAIQFIHGTEQDIPVTTKYDVVISNFYLDMFANHQLENVVNKIKLSLNTGTIWIVTDFVNEKWWHSTMLKVMYWFFRIACGLETQQLPEWNKSMDKADLKEIELRFFYKGFIKTALFQG